MREWPRIGCGLTGVGQRFVFTADFVEEGELSFDAFDPGLCRSSGKYVDLFWAGEGVLCKEMCILSSECENGQQGKHRKAGRGVKIGAEHHEAAFHQA